MTKWIAAEEAFKGFFSRKDQYVFQFHDTRAANGAVGGTKRVFTTAHPSDFVVCDAGEFFFAEVKNSENEPSFPFANIKQSQWAAATRTIAAKGAYFFFLRRDSTGDWFKVPASVLLAQQKVKQSIRWEALLPYQWRVK